jgi:hypothetical protein
VWGNVGEGVAFSGLLLLGACSLVTLTASRFIYIPWLSEQRLTTGVAIAVVVVLASSLLIGIGGLIWIFFRLGVSAERRSAMAQQAPQLKPPSGFYPPPRDYPTLPRNEELANSPGVHLSFRLPQRSVPTWSVFAAGTFSVMWDVLLSVFAVTFVTQWLSGNFLWYLVPVVAGLGYLAWRATSFFLERMAEALRIGPTHIEVSDMPFFPGGEYQIAFIQSGKMTLKSLKVSLICEEEATFREGTDVRVETRRVVDRELLVMENARINPTNPLVRKSHVVCPKNSMHSFQASCNKVDWKLRAKGALSDGTTFERDFSIVIYPTPRKQHNNPRWNR